MQKKDGKQGKKLKIQKLVLSKETLRVLRGEDLQHAKGGALPTTATERGTKTAFKCSCVHLCSNAGAC